jgi:hypothetical protein
MFDERRYLALLPRDPTETDVRAAVEATSGRGGDVFPIVANRTRVGGGGRTARVHVLGAGVVISRPRGSPLPTGDGGRRRGRLPREGAVIAERPRRLNQFEAA